MLEFAVVLLIKRAIEFQRKKKSKLILNCNRREQIDRSTSTECQIEFLLKKKKLHADENEVQLDNDSTFRDEEQEKELLYSTTDVIDFVSLFVFLFCYITFNCMYMIFYISQLK